MGNTSHVGHGYSIWIMAGPGSAQARSISGIIARLSKEHKTPYFEPHVTLIGSIRSSRYKALRIAGALAASCNAFTLPLCRLGSSDAYFRSVFIRMRRTAALEELHAAAADAFGMDGNGFMPHISLLYSDSDGACRRRIAKGIDLGAISKYGGFRAQRLCLYSTTGAVRSWRCVGEFRLGVRDKRA